MYNILNDRTATIFQFVSSSYGPRKEPGEAPLPLVDESGQELTEYDRDQIKEKHRMRAEQCVETRRPHAE
jgi:hypothetical protein